MLLYIIGAAIVSVLYAFVIGFGVGFPNECIRMDALVFGVSFSAGLTFLWNILKYGAPSADHPFYRAIYIFTMGILIIGIGIGAEALLFSTYFPALLPLFTTTLYIRILVSSLLYIIVTMHYSHKLTMMEKEEEEEMEPVGNIAPIPLPKEEILERINIKTGNGIKVIPVNDILFIKAEGDYVSIHTMEGHWLKEQTMKYMEVHLPQAAFVRVHRSFIINTSTIKHIERYGQQHLVELRNGDKIRISPTGYKTLKGKLRL